MRMLGVDLGGKRTGLSLSDAHGITCSPLAVLSETDCDRLAEKIAQVAREYEVEEIVVGLPRPLRGGTNAQLERALAFKALLERTAGATVTVWDERFTTRLAERAKPAGPKDAVAASYMLQSYLDYRGMCGKREP